MKNKTHHIGTESLAEGSHELQLELCIPAEISPVSLLPSIKNHPMQNNDSLSNTCKKMMARTTNQMYLLGCRTLEHHQICLGIDIAKNGGSVFK